MTRWLWLLLLAGCATPNVQQRAQQMYRSCEETRLRILHTNPESYMSHCMCTPDSFGTTGHDGPLHCGTQ